MLLLQGAQVRFLVEELRSHMLQYGQKKKKKKTLLSVLLGMHPGAELLGHTVILCLTF